MMDWQQMSLAGAGMIGAITALIHGVLMQKFMVRPFEAALVSEGRTSASLLRLLPVLMHLSTFAWFVGGVALIGAAFGSDEGARRAIALVVGGLYLFGAVGNGWATRGRHPGWVLMTIACGLIAPSLV